MDDFDTFFGHKLAHLIFSAAEQISKQRISLYKRQFTVLGFLPHIYGPWEMTKCSEVIHDCVGLIAKPTLPCRRKAPKRFDDGASPQTYETPKDRHAPPHVLWSDWTNCWWSWETVYPKGSWHYQNNFANCNKKKCISTDLEMWDDFDLEKLKIELSMLPAWSRQVVWVL